MKRTGVFLAIAFASAGAFAGGIRAVQLDLARQKESPAFVTNYMSRVRAVGYNTIVLYLEDRVKTPSYPYSTDADSYSLEEMAGIVRYGMSIGLDVVPVISPLGHTERFLAHKELAKFGEQCEGVGRWGKTENPGCFCLENPEARAWMEKYIAEVVAVFPGRNLHLGFDETWNLGYCTRCRPLVEKEGLAALYMRSVHWAHGLAKKLGKRMWMWDDFFEYFDPKVLETVPRDILMCQWNYDRNIERTGPRSHFGGRLRRNILATYERLGFECLVCPWFDYENVRTFSEYAANHKTTGFFFTQWEMETDFHSIFFPRVLAAAELWSGRGSVVDGDWISRSLEACFPTIDAEARRMLEGLMFDQSKLKFTTVTKESILNGNHEDSKLRYWWTALEHLRRHPSHPGIGDVPADSFSEAAFLEDIVVRTEMAILCAEVQNVGRYLVLPDRTAKDSSAAKDRLLGIRTRWRELVTRRESQWGVWRPGIRSKKELAYRDHLQKLIEELVACSSEAGEEEWLLEVDLAMIDTHGCPKCKAEVLVAGVWQTVAEGVWKPKGTDGPYSAKCYPFRMSGIPSVLRLTASGYGDCGLCHVSLRNRQRRFVPSKVVSTQGRVQDAENLLIDDFRGMRFGLPDCTAAFLSQKLSEAQSSVVCELKSSEER